MISISEKSTRASAYQARVQQRREELISTLSIILSGRRYFTWEVGCGHGHFLTAYAQAHPDKLCVGIDIMGDRIARAGRKRDRAKLQNLFFLHAEGRLFLETLPAGVEIAETFILFPDPWPKVRHHKHRILSAEFLRGAAARSASDARLCFRTDYSPYFEDTCRTLSHSPDWLASSEAWPFEYHTVFQGRAHVFHSWIARRRSASKPQA